MAWQLSDAQMIRMQCTSRQCAAYSFVIFCELCEPSIRCVIHWCLSVRHWIQFHISNSCCCVLRVTSASLSDFCAYIESIRNWVNCKWVGSTTAKQFVCYHRIVCCFLVSVTFTLDFHSGLERWECVCVCDKIPELRLWMCCGASLFLFTRHSPDLRDQHTNDATLSPYAIKTKITHNQCVCVCGSCIGTKKRVCGHFSWVRAHFPYYFFLLFRVVFAFRTLFYLWFAIMLTESILCGNTVHVHVRVRLVGMNTRSIARLWHIHKYFFFSFVSKRQTKRKKKMRKETSLLLTIYRNAQKWRHTQDRKIANGTQNEWQPVSHVR